MLCLGFQPDFSILPACQLFAGIFFGEVVRLPMIFLCVHKSIAAVPDKAAAHK
jgi:hypothetical protein